MKKITYNVSVQVADGPKTGITQSLDVEAYDVINVDIDAGAADVDVEVAPGEAQLLVISVAQPTYPQKLSYKVKGQTTKFVLDAPHILVGGAVKALLGADPKVLQFSNDAANPKVPVQILVGRDATP